MKLVHYADPILWTSTMECSNVDNTWPEADEINEMIELGEELDLQTITHNQVGGGGRFFVGRLDDSDWDVFINPEVSVQDLDDYILVTDRCPHSRVVSALKRFRKLTLRWADLGGNMYERTFYPAYLKCCVPQSPNFSRCAKS